MGDWAKSGGDSSSGSHNLQSLVESSIRDGVELEKCVVSQYTTTVEQKFAFEKHLSTCSNDSVPIEWVIDIADQTNGW
jgi:hypothetical protein